METFSEYVTEILGVFLPATQNEETCGINVSSDKIGTCSSLDLFNGNTGTQ